MTPTSPRPRCSRNRPADDDPTAALLARYLARSTRTSDGADTLARTLLRRHHDLNGVCAAARDRTDAALALVADDLQLLQDLAERLARPVRIERRLITSWTGLQAYVTTALAGLPRERFLVLYLDRRNGLLNDDWIAEGTVDHAPVYPREVVRRALALSASALILVHNHPTGDPSPSAADIDMTRRVVEAARALDLQVHDHVVVGRNGVASFKALGLL